MKKWITPALGLGLASTLAFPASRQEVSQCLLAELRHAVGALGNPHAEHENFLAYLSNLQQGYLRRAKEQGAGAAQLWLKAQGEDGVPIVYRSIDLSTLEAGTGHAPLAKELLELPGKYRIFVIDQYKQRLDLSDAQLAEFNHISETTQNRSFLVVVTQDDPSSPGRTDILGGAIAVTSSSPEQKLPVESISGESVERSAGKVAVELGRYSVSRDSPPDTSGKVLLMIASVVMGMGNVDRIVIHTDVLHKRLYSRYGFREMKKFQNGSSGAANYILEVSPAEFLAKVTEKELEPPQP